MTRSCPVTNVALARLAALLLLVVSSLGAGALAAQSSTGLADVDSAGVARAAWRRGQTAARDHDDATAVREFARAASAWPGQPVYPLGLAVAAARAGDSASVRRALSAYADLELGEDLRADTTLARYVSRPDFASLLARHDGARAPLVRSRIVATFPDSATWPEGMTHDARSRRWYVASVRHRTIVELSADGKSRELWPRGGARIGAVLAIRADTARRLLWATTSGMPQMEGYVPADSSIAALLQVRASDGKILQRWDLPPIAGGHVLGDVAVAPSGDVYVSDSREPVLYRLPRGRGALQRITSPHFRSLQGVAPSSDARVVYVADYSHGIMRVDVPSGDVTRVVDAPRSTSLGCDGIVWDRNGIIAIQNGVAPARVVRFSLDATGKRFVRAEVIDRNFGIADEPTIGEVVGGDFVYVANSQWEKHGNDGTALPGAKLARPVLLAVPLPALQKSAKVAPDTAGVRRAVLDYVEGFYEGDTAKLIRSVRTDVAKYGFWMPKDSTRYAGEAMPFAEFLSYARRVKERNHPAPANAPREIVLFDVQDQTASAKLRAFWGTDYLLLGRFDGRWMITHVLWQSPQRAAR